MAWRPGRDLAVDLDFGPGDPIAGGRVARDASLCKACGRCAAVCPTGATEGVVTDRDAAVAGLIGRLIGVVDFE